MNNAKAEAGQDALDDLDVVFRALKFPEWVRKGEVLAKAFLRRERDALNPKKSGMNMVCP